MIQYINKFSILILQIIILTIISCNDNFKDSIIKENNYTGNSEFPLVSFATSSSYTLNENGTVDQINLVLSKASTDIISVTVADLLTGSANPGIDYNYTGWSSPEVITFDPGEMVKTISITPVQDSLYEGSNETIYLALSAPINAKLGLSSHQIIIYDDDTLPVVSFASSISNTMNENAIQHDINIVLSQTSGSIVAVTVTELHTGSATSGTDYNYTGWLSPEVITFNPGETTKTLSITPVQDSIFEGAFETINLDLSSPDNAVLGTNSHQILIYDDDTLPLVSFAALTSNTLNEDVVQNDINIILSKSSASIVTVVVTDLQTGSATSLSDYNYTGWSSPEVITFNPGEITKTLSITPVQDAIDEGTGETINLALSSPTNAALGASSHIMTITDDDGWVKLGDTATPRAGMAAAVYGNWLYIYGGEDYSGVLNDFWRYDLATGEYEILTSNDTFRAYATLIELKGKLYLYGGEINATGTLYDNQHDGIYYYDTSLSSWASFNGSDTNGTFPDERAYHVAVPLYVYNSNPLNSVESIFLQGGKDSSGNNLSGDIHELDFVPLYEVPANKRRWSSVSIVHTRSEHAAVYYNDNIYFFGGYNSGTHYNDLWSYNLTTFAFNQIITTGITIIPVRSGISMIEHNGKLYVFGGKKGTDYTDYLDDLWVYSIGSNTWTRISTAPFKRCFYSAVKYNNSLIIFGGYYLNSSNQRVYSSEVWKYNLE